MTGIGEEPRVVAGSPASSPRNRHLRCYFYRDRNGMFAAECVDLDILAKGKSPEIAKRKLRNAVEGYIQTAISMGEVHSLVPRPAPLSHRLRYYYLAVMDALSRGGKTRSYDLPAGELSRCHA